MKLEIELVPSTSWSDNLRARTTRLVWQKLRKEVCDRYGWRCAICGLEGRLALHEIWRFDDASHVQTLEGLFPLCTLCHFVKHFGRAQQLSAQGKLNLEAVIEHFMEVNGCSRKDFEEHRRAAFEQWRARSEHEWRVDLDRYKAILK